MNKYIKEAKKYYFVALDEINKARENGRTELAVDGCDKGWLALNLAIKAMLVDKGVKPKELPKSYRGVRYFITKYGDRELWKIYTEARVVLHLDGFWDRDVVFERVDPVLKDIKEYIDKLENEQE